MEDVETYHSARMILEEEAHILVEADIDLDYIEDNPEEVVDMGRVDSVR